MNARCDVCGAALHPRGRHTTGVCFVCRMAAAEFLRAWLTDLRASGLTLAAAADIAGVTHNTAKARLRDARLRREATA